MRAAALMVAIMLTAGGCGKEQPAPPPAPKTVQDWFTIKVGDRTVRMQLAVTSPEQQRGLMERRDLGPDDGMLFPYKKPQQMHFWMRNTPTPLDIGFFDADGVLREIHPLYPRDEKTVSSTSDQLKFALEMNQGWFRQHGMLPGAKLDLKAVAEAMRARGFDLREWRLE